MATYDEYRIVYAYHGNTEKSNDKRFDNLVDLLKSLEAPYNYTDKEGNQYFVGVRKNDELYFSLRPTQALIDVIKCSLNNSQGLNTLQPTQDNTTMAAKTGFEYTVILHAIPVKDNSGNDVTPDSEIIIKPTTVIAVDSNHVTRIASRKIDTKVSDSDLGRVEIKVRNL